MRKCKKRITVILICITVVVIVLAGFYFLLQSILPKTYSSAKKECEKVLEKYQVQMEETASASLYSDKTTFEEFRSYKYDIYKEGGYVKFEIDAQGMLGGQYWELVYTEGGMLYGQTENYLYEERNGNNIIKAERLNEHWWYLWTDYDGTTQSYK